MSIIAMSSEGLSVADAVMRTPAALHVLLTVLFVILGGCATRGRLERNVAAGRNLALLARRKNDPAKLEIAARLRRETTLSIKAIAARVQLGTSKAANMKLHSHMKRSSACDRAQAQLGI